MRERERVEWEQERKRIRKRERERKRGERVCVCDIGTLENWTHLRKVQTLFLFKKGIKEGFHFAFFKCKIY